MLSVYEDEGSVEFLPVELAADKDKLYPTTDVWSVFMVCFHACHSGNSRNKQCILGYVYKSVQLREHYNVYQCALCKFLFFWVSLVIIRTDFDRAPDT